MKIMLYDSGVEIVVYIPNNSNKTVYNALEVIKIKCHK